MYSDILFFFCQMADRVDFGYYWFYDIKSDDIEIVTYTLYYSLLYKLSTSLPFLSIDKKLTSWTPPN